MKQEAQLIKANGEITTVVPANGKEFTLQECYKLLECDMVEVLQLSTGNLMVIDEEGKLKSDMKLNRPATALYMEGRMKPSEFKKQMKEKLGEHFIDAGMDGEIEGVDLNEAIVGNAIVCSPEMFT